MKKVIIVGPAHPLRGGIATFNHCLADAFKKNGDACSIVSFSLQYPRFFFPGKTQFSTASPPENIAITPLINSVNPYNWIATGNYINKQKADILVVRYWIPFMGPALGTILRMVKRNRHTRIICIADNIIPHESRPGDTSFTRYFLQACDAFVVMSKKVFQDLRSFEQRKPAKLVHHPLYNNFGEKISKEAARKFLKIPYGEKVILFFGFIRHYKGLDLLLQAMQHEVLKKLGVKLLVAGEFYEDAKMYKTAIDALKKEGRIYLHTHFIPDEEVKHYLCAADCVVQPYRAATQSGVTPLAYHFEKPMVVTHVGGLPDLVPHGQSGLVCAPQPDAIANAIAQFYSLGEAHFVPYLRREKEKYTWSHLVKAIEALAQK